MRTLILVFAAACLAAASPPKAGAADPCPPKKPRSHCVYMELHKATRTLAEQVVKRLKADGVSASIDESLDLSGMMTDAQLRKLFGAKVAYNMTGASAKDLLVCEAQNRVDRAAGALPGHRVGAHRLRLSLSRGLGDFDSLAPCLRLSPCSARFASSCEGFALAA